MWTDVWAWLKAAHSLHSVVLAVTAIGFFVSLVRTRFWFPTYVHVLAALALAIGVGTMKMTPANAPIKQGEWAGLEEGLMVAAFPLIVYFVFVFFGGQVTAHARRRQRDAGDEHR